MKQMRVRAAACIGLVCAVAALAVGCNERALAPVEEGLSAEIQITSYGQRNQVDILWVVDNSGSMCEEQADLRQNVGRFVEILDQTGIDFQLAVVTTDMQDPTESGRFQNIPDGSQGPSCAQTVDISQCPTENGEAPPPLIIRSEDPRYRLEGGRLDTALLGRDLGCSLTVGTQGYGFEQGLEAMRSALGPELSQGHNAGFLREDAYLAVIFVSDENDCSGDIDHQNGNNCEWYAEQLEDVSSYVDFLVGLKGSESRVSVAGIISPDPGARFAPGAEVTPSCVSAHGEAYAGYRYEELGSAFSQHQFANICQPPFDEVLDHLASSLLPGLDGYCLPRAPERGEEIEIIVTRRGGAVEGAQSCEALPGGAGSRCVLAQDQHVLAQDGSCHESGWRLHLPHGEQDDVFVRYRQAVGEGAAPQSSGSGLRALR